MGPLCNHGDGIARRGIRGGVLVWWFAFRMFGMGSDGIGSGRAQDVNHVDMR
jgi:hypothetical protein